MTALDLRDLQNCINFAQIFATISKIISGRIIFRPDINRKLYRNKLTNISNG